MLKSIDIRGNKAYRNKINRLIKTVKRPKAALFNAKLLMHRDVMDHFRDEKGPDGAWEKSFRAKNSGGKTLDKSGGRFGLKGSMTSDSGKDYAKVGTNKKYARIHDEGGIIRAKGGYKGDGYLRFKMGDRWIRKRSVKMPKRQFLWLSRKAGEKILNKFLDYLEKA